MSGDAEFTTTEEDLVAANQLHARQLWNRRAVLRGWMLTTIAFALILFSFREQFDWALLFAPIAAVPFMMLGAGLARLTFATAARRQYRQGQAFWRPTKIEWTDRSIRFSSDRGQVEHSWSDYFAWAADDRSILLYQSANAFFTLPAAHLGTHVRTQIVSDLSNSGVPHRSAR